MPFTLNLIWEIKTIGLCKDSWLFSASFWILRGISGKRSQKSKERIDAT